MVLAEYKSKRQKLMDHSLHCAEETDKKTEICSVCG